MLGHSLEEALQMQRKLNSVMGLTNVKVGQDCCYVRGRQDGSRVFKAPVVFIVLLDQHTCFTLAVGFRIQWKQLL